MFPEIAAANKDVDSWSRGVKLMRRLWVQLEEIDAVFKQ